MKIEIIECPVKIEQSSKGWDSCVPFEAHSYVHNSIKNEVGIQGLVLIDDLAIKFDYSCLGNDGNISTHNDMHRRIVKTIIPIYAYNKSLANNKRVTMSHSFPQNKF